jgi:hypothetical protein
MVHLIGMYLATSALLNAFEVRAPNPPIDRLSMDDMLTSHPWSNPRHAASP